MSSSKTTKQQTKSLEEFKRVADAMLKYLNPPKPKRVQKVGNDPTRDPHYVMVFALASLGATEEMIVRVSRKMPSAQDHLICKQIDILKKGGRFKQVALPELLAGLEGAMLIFALDERESMPPVWKALFRRAVKELYDTLKAPVETEVIARAEQPSLNGVCS